MKISPVIGQRSATKVRAVVDQIHGVADRNQSHAGDDAPYTIDLEVSPTPGEVDAHAIEYNRLDKKLEDAKQAATDAAAPLAALKTQLIALVRKFGGAHGKTSKLVHGIVWELMGTFGQSTTQDAAAVERLRLALVESGKSRLLKKLFTKRVSWQFNSKASEVIKTEKLTAEEMALLLQCSDTTDSTPKLDVRTKKKSSS